MLGPQNNNDNDWRRRAAMHRRVQRMLCVANRRNREHRFRPHGYAAPAEIGVATGLRNDEGASVCLGTECFDTFYCNRDLGHAAIPCSDGRCGPSNGPQCPSCDRLHTSQRLECLKRQFPGVTEEAPLVAALRAEGGNLSAAQKRLVELGAIFQPDDTLVDAMARKCHFPRAMVQVALKQTGGIIEDAETWVYEEMESCFQAASAEKTSVNEEASSKSDPEAVTNFGRFATQAPPLTDLFGDAPSHPIITKGHRMIRVDADERLEQFQCVLCSCRVPSTLTGAHRCEMCNLCEGCVQSNAVFHCPAPANGGHLHHHPLQFGAGRKNIHCDINGEGCKDKHAGSRLTQWRCPTCDFDICSVCMTLPAPQNFNRRTAAVQLSTSSIGDNSDGVDRQNMDIDPFFDQIMRDFAVIPNAPTTCGQFDQVAAEHDVAERWQQGLRQNANAGMGRVVVGTGRVGTTFATPPELLPYEQASRRRRIHHNLRTSSVAGTVGILSDEAKKALELFKARRQTGSVENHALQCSAVTVTDLTLAEDLLQRAQKVEDHTLRSKLHEAIAGGRLGIAGTLLMTAACTMISRDEASSETQSNCWCGDIVDARSAPSGAVCCLNGHKMHPSCAADLLLGGGSCPTCREPLFFPRIADSEAKSAAEALRRETPREQNSYFAPADDKEGLGLGDLVQVSSSIELSRATQEEVGGWHDDMSDACGSQGVVTEVVAQGKAVVVRVRSKNPNGQQSHFKRKMRQRRRCYSCRQEISVACVLCGQCDTCCGRERICVDLYHEWTWDTSLLLLIQRSNACPPEEDIVDADDMEAKRKCAEKQLMHLRMELLAVKKARENLEREVEILSSRGRKTAKASDLSASSLAALGSVGTAVSAADYERALHLLLLAGGHRDSPQAISLMEAIEIDVSRGHLESAARKLRRYRVEQTCEEASWQDALTQTAEYVVKPSVRVELVAIPQAGAPKTGFCLAPEFHFRSTSEYMDKDGLLWLQVASPNQKSGMPVISYDAGSANYRPLVGSRVRRGENWRYGTQDGGEDNEGVIVGQGSGVVSVKWNGIDGLFQYCSRENSPVELVLAGDTPAEQGWMCLRAGGAESPLAVTKATTALKCSCCGNNLNPPHAGDDNFTCVDKRKVCKGDRLLVAATLEPVDVEFISDERIYCSFPQTEGPGVMASDGHKPTAAMPRKRARNETDHGDIGNGKTGKFAAERRHAIWYSARDLVLPQNTLSAPRYSFEETRLIDNLPRTRRELVLMNGGDLEKAKLIWSALQKQSVHENIPFASCLGGHLLDACCFEASLLSGRSCPAPGCSEPLWVPSAKRKSTGNDNNDSCQSSSGENFEAEITIGNATGQATVAADNDAVTAQGDLKMCPCCCSGPFINENCQNMRSHHGECTAIALSGHRSGREMCTAAGTFRASPTDIAHALTRVSDTRSVADVLPRCPTHNVAVMFNGCLVCGHLFTETRWHTLPKWDPKGKEKLDMDKKRMNAARLLSAQVRKEAGMLHYERSALFELKGVEKEMHD